VLSRHIPYFMLLVYVVGRLGLTTYKTASGWVAQARDDEFLVGRQLHNVG
jgi:hypothetical protein